MSLSLERLLIKTKDDQFYIGYKIEDHFEIPSINPDEENIVLFLPAEKVEKFYIVDELLAGVENRIKMVKKMLNIAGVLYEIKMVDGDYCGGNMGKSNFAEAKIFINKDMPLQVQENVLLHEILHICYRNGYLCKEDGEERVVEVLTNFLYPVLQEHPFDLLSVEG